MNYIIERDKASNKEKLNYVINNKLRENKRENNFFSRKYVCDKKYI